MWVGDYEYGDGVDYGCVGEFDESLDDCGDGCCFEGELE